MAISRREFLHTCDIFLKAAGLLLIGNISLEIDPNNLESRFRVRIIRNKSGVRPDSHAGELVLGAHACKEIYWSFPQCTLADWSPHEIHNLTTTLSSLPRSFYRRDGSGSSFCLLDNTSQSGGVCAYTTDTLVRSWDSKPHPGGWPPVIAVTKKGFETRKLVHEMAHLAVWGRSDLTTEIHTLLGIHVDPDNIDIQSPEMVDLVGTRLVPNGQGRWLPRDPSDRIARGAEQPSELLPSLSELYYEGEEVFRNNCEGILSDTTQTKLLSFLKYKVFEGQEYNRQTIVV